MVDLTMTAPSACMKHFKTNYLKEQHLAIVPEKGYKMRENQSCMAVKFLKWYGYKNNGMEKLQFCKSLNEGKKIFSFKLDGYIERENKKPLGIEINGCYWHGCNIYYPNDQQKLFGDIKAGQLRKNNNIKHNFLKEHVELEVYWECQIGL